MSMNQSQTTSTNATKSTKSNFTSDFTNLNQNLNFTFTPGGKQKVFRLLTNHDESFRVSPNPVATVRGEELVRLSLSTSN